VAVGDNAVWVANSADGTVSVIDPRQNKVEKTIHVGGHPAGVAIGAGKIWISVQPDVREAAAGGGGRLRIENRYDVDSLDPALASTTSSWAIEYATCAKLLNYPDEPAPRGTKLVPEVAQALPARSPDGKTYTITIRRGFRFSPPSNAPVTAETFKETIERSLDPRMRSPASYFVQDIVGEAAFVKGNAKHIAGVTATGNHLTIRLTDVSADFPTRISLPFFCAVPQGTPVDPRGLRLIPSAGPYYVASYIPGAGILLKRNPNYRGSRPRRFHQISIKTGVAESKAIADARAGRTDWAYHLSREQAARLAPRYGPRSDAAAAGHQQLFASPELVVDYLAMNTSRRLFKDVRLRKAVNYAIDRHALAPYGYVSDSGSGLPIDQYLPSGIPGFRRLDVYPSTPNLSKARRLARGHGGRAVLYACSRPTCVHLAQIVTANLRAIGIDVTTKTGSSGWLYSRLGKRGEPYDLAIAAWVADYPDPADFINNMLSGGQLASGGANTNFARFDAPAINRRLDEAAALTGADRYRAYARLDADLTRHLVPWAPFATDSDQDFFSARIGCQLDQPIYGIDLGALCVAAQHP
jgi:peptide/nickel transport system substrate-binding protein